MIKVEVEIEIARPPAQVFAYMADLNNDPNWHTDVLESKLKSGTGGSVGDLYAWTVQYPNSPPADAVAEITELEQDRRLGISAVAGELRQTMIFTLQPSGGGTKVVRELTLEHDKLSKIMAPVMKPMVKARSAGYLEKLKKILEES
ncbi:MAG: SRPBCC family protein [Actinomycetota bacterium]